MQLNNAIKSRRSVRNFKKKKPDWRDIIECIDLMRYAPMAGNTFTPRIILVSDEKKIAKLALAAQQDFIAQCHYVVVVCSDSARTVNVFGDKELAEKCTRQQSGAAIQNFLLAIEEKKLSTCWIGAFVEEQVKTILQIPENIKVEAMFPIGYSAREPKPLTRIELDRVIYFDKYKNIKMKKPKYINA